MNKVKEAERYQWQRMVEFEDAEAALLDLQEDEDALVEDIGLAVEEVHDAQRLLAQADRELEYQQAKHALEVDHNLMSQVGGCPCGCIPFIDGSCSDTNEISFE